MSASLLSYYDFNKNIPQIVDVSGGYGRPSAPTALEYSETGEWVFGEYALSGQRSEMIFTDIMARLGTFDYVNIDGKPVSYAEILGIYLGHLIEHCRGINPKAEVAGIIVAKSPDLTEAKESDLRSAISYAGLKEQLLGLVDERECALNRMLCEHTPKGGFMVADFGESAFRAGVYEFSGDNKIECVSYKSFPELGTLVLNAKADELIQEMYGKSSKSIDSQLTAFCRSHRYVLLSRANAGGKPAKLYFNFAYPPFAMTVDDSRVKEMVKPFVEGIQSAALAAARIGGATNTGTFFLTGGGFEYPFSHAAIAAAFPRAEIISLKNTKSAAAEGASIIAAARLGAKTNRIFAFRDKYRLTDDLGLMIRTGSGDAFYPLAKSNAYIWDEFPSMSFLLTTGTRPAPIIEVVAKGKDRALGRIAIPGLPERPPGTTKLKIGLEFEKVGGIRVNIKDMGFGELFPSSEVAVSASVILDAEK